MGGRNEEEGEKEREIGVKEGREEEEKVLDIT